MPEWKEPPRIKFYEALGAIADGRIEKEGNQAKVWSSSGNKYYDVAYGPEEHAISANDNGSYWQGYLGYPAIAFLLQENVLPYDAALADLLKGIAWKDLNVRLKNDWDAAIAEIHASLENEQVVALETYVQVLEKQLRDMHLKRLGPKTKPPAGY